MNSYKSASNQLNRNYLKIKNELVSINDCLNRVVASDIVSNTNYPAGDNTALDGFAVNSKETKNLSKNRSQKFKIIKILAAGDNPNIKGVKKYSTA